MKQIVHFGPGNFHRAHQAWYTHLANQQTDTQWRIIAVSLQSSTARDQLAHQDFAYTLVINGEGPTDFQRISVHDRILVAPESPDSVLDLIADPQTTIVTLTVTEKGYHIDGPTGHLNTEDPDIAAELAGGNPTTAIGFLAFGLQRRKQNGAAPLTIISCDNLSSNGDTLQQMVREFDRHADLGLASYLDSSVRFPGTMVDRITPATTDGLRAEVLRETGWADRSPVATEAFSEWIIEDNFAAAKPAWNKVGAEFVEDVSPYELRKLRLLNGPHSFLAYAGLLTGHIYVHEAIDDAVLRQAVEELMLEATATLPARMQADAPDYCRKLIARFANPALKHELAQIAGDGSQKLPVRILPVISERSKKGFDSPRACDAISHWLVHIYQRSSAGTKIVDPLAQKFAAMLQSTSDRHEIFAAILNTLSPGPDIDQTRILDRAGEIIDA
uniref:mannitol dehydrogenase family protein n=1 Tax=Pararhizobium sp. IMCC3301 TaxID=3067904 RepID=UPI002741A59F|nr:mannitol dehydrogenase family protein [Pararhizobium sp. IMCC3301]